MARIYKRNKDNCWWIDYNAGGKRYRKKVGPNKEQAQRVLNKTLVDVAEKKYFGISKISFKDFSVKYLENTMSDNKPSSIRRKRVAIKNLLSCFGDKNLDETTPLMIEGYKNKRLAKGISNATFNRERTCLHHMFKKAIDWDFIKENPVAKVSPLKENNEIVRYLTKEELKKLVKACPKWLKEIVVTAITTLMRKAEILNLKWDDVNFKQKFIKVINPKSGKDEYVPLNSSLAKMFGKIKRHPNNPFVFCNDDGLHRKNIDRAFKRALKAAGIKNFRVHDLRHTGASYLAMAGVPIKTIQELLRHKSIAVTLRYAHLSPVHKYQAIEKLSKVVRLVV
ncbi:MAG: tyrosine-type recombinase/integrase [Elusimicrobiota bacterium]